MEENAAENLREDKERTTLSLSLTVRDKKTLKILAAEKDITIAAMIHEWIQEHAGEVKK